MGIDYDGGMIVGACGDDMLDCVPEGMEFYEWAQDNGLESMAMYYDADSSDCYYGYTVDDVPVPDIEGEWLTDVKAKAAKFKELTGMDALLIGSQDIW